MAVPDRRVLKSQPNQPIGLVVKKVRQAGELSTQPLPSGAPSWAVKQGELMYDCAVAQYFTSYSYYNNFILYYYNKHIYFITKHSSALYIGMAKVLPIIDVLGYDRQNSSFSSPFPRSDSTPITQKGSHIST